MKSKKIFTSPSVVINKLKWRLSYTWQISFFPFKEGIRPVALFKSLITLRLMAGLEYVWKPYLSKTYHNACSSCLW